MFKRVAILLFCLLIVFIATFGFAVGVVSVPTIFTYAADGDNPEFFPYMDEMQDSTAAVYVYMKKYGFTFNQLSDTALNIPSAIITNSLMAYSKATGTDYAQNLNTIKNGSGLLKDGNGEYYYTPQAQDLLNKFTNWVAESYDLNDDGTPQLGITFGEYGSLEGDDGIKYAVFNKRSTEDFDWGSCAPLGSIATPYIDTAGTYNVMTPWGSSTLTVTIANNGNTGATVSGVSGSVYSTSIYGTVTTVLGSPCLLIIDGNYKRIYKGVVQYTYSTSTQIVSYKLLNGGTYQQYDTDIPKITQTIDYDGSELPDDNVTPTDPTVINVNYNTYQSILNNYYNIVTDPGDDPDDPDPDDPYEVPYNPYPDNPDYDPNDPGSNPGTVTPPINPIDPDGSDNVNIDFPDFDLNLPEINWSLGDLSKKFPFSIPFDMVSLVRILDAPAEAPRFEGTVNFGFTTWDYDINLDSFSSVAAVCRIVETLLFVFGLILITRNLIKG